MSDEIAFYSNPMSRGRIVHWMLEEVGAPYRFEVVDFQKGDHKKSVFLDINPMGKLPAIVHRGVVVTECAAICNYLADAFPAAGLAPLLNDPMRASFLRWMFFGAGCVEPALMDKMLDRPPVERPEALGYGRYADVLDTMEKFLSPGPYVLGDRFSAVDVYMGSQIGFGMMMKSLEPRPTFQAYMARLSERPAYQRFIEKSNRVEQRLKAG